MYEYENEIFVNHPVQQVFEYVTRCENTPQWVPEIVDSWQDSPGPPAVGTVVTEVVQLWFWKNEVHWHIEEYQPFSKCTFTADSFFGKIRVVFTFEPLEGGTKISCWTTTRLKGIFKLGETARIRKDPQTRDQLLGNIKRNLEGQNGDQVVS